MDKLLFVVEITRITGDYESTFRKLVSAANQYAAEEIALQGECHGFYDSTSPDFDPEIDTAYGFEYMQDDNFWVNEDTIAKAVVLFKVPKDIEALVKLLFGSYSF